MAATLPELTAHFRGVLVLSLCVKTFTQTKFQSSVTILSFGPRRRGRGPKAPWADQALSPAKPPPPLPLGPELKMVPELQNLACWCILPRNESTRTPRDRVTRRPYWKLAPNLEKMQKTLLQIV